MSKYRAGHPRGVFSLSRDSAGHPPTDSYLECNIWNWRQSNFESFCVKGMVGTFLKLVAFDNTTLFWIHTMQESIDDELTHIGVQTDGLTEDLLILAKWVKRELFVRVKFLYNQEKDLRIGGSLYNLFVLQCKGRLVGMKVHSGRSEDFKDKYIKAVWSRGTNKKKNLVTEGLNTRRSGVYSATQNRFTGKFHACGASGSPKWSSTTRSLIPHRSL